MAWRDSKAHQLLILSDLSYCMAAAGAAHSSAEQAKTEPMVLRPSTACDGVAGRSL